MATVYLTQAQIEMEGEHYGVPVATIGEDGDMLALGHFEPRRAVAAFNRHARTFLGLRNILDDRSAEADDMLASVAVGWGQFRKPRPELEEDPDFEWVMDACSAFDEHATPYTLLHVA